MIQRDDRSKYYEDLSNASKQCAVDDHKVLNSQLEINQGLIAAIACIANGEETHHYKS